MGCGASIWSARENTPVEDFVAPLPSTPGSVQTMAAEKELTAEGEQDLSWGDEQRGVSVEHMSTQLLQAIKAAGLPPDSKVYEVEPVVIRPLGAALTCPRDGRLGTAYVDAISGPLNAGMATHMISYTWGYSMQDIAVALAAFCTASKLQLAETYIWMCALCVNQHRVQEKTARGEVVPFEEFEATFGARVQGIGHVLALLAPWQAPLYVNRVWCVYELYVGTTTSGVKLDIILPPREENDFFECLGAKGLGPVWETLQALNVEDAQASVEEDRRRILQRVEDGPGAEQLNKTVRTHIQSWFVDTACGHLDELLAGAKNTTDRTDLMIDIAQNVLGYQRALGRFQEAEECAGRCLEFCKQTMGEQSASFARVLGELARAVSYRGEVARAVQLFRDSLDIFKATVGDASLLYATGLSDLAGAIASRGDVSDAIALYQQALGIIKDTPERQQNAYLSTLSNLAAAVHSQGDLKYALELNQEVMDIEACTVGKTSPQYATTLNNRAGMLEALGDCQQAISLYEQVLEVEAATIGENSHAYAVTLSNLAGVIKMAGADLDRAIDLYNRALKIKAATVGKCSSSYATTLGNLAEASRLQGNTEEAIELYRQVLAIDEKAVGKDSPDYATTLMNLAKALQEQKDFKQAKANLQQALAIAEASLGKRSPLYATALSDLAITWELEGDLDKATRLLEEAVDIKETVLGKESQDYATSLNDLAMMTKKNGQLQRAAELYKRALSIDDKTLGPDTEDYAASAFNLGRVYEDMGNLREALEYFEAAATAERASLGECESGTVEALSRVRQRIGELE